MAMSNDFAPDKLNTLLARIVIALAVCVVLTAAAVAYLWLRPVDGARRAQEIAYVAVGTDGNLDLFLADAAGRRITQLTKTTDDELYPAWSPDGAALAYVRVPLRAIYGGADPGAVAGMYVMTFEDGKPTERALLPAGAAGIGVPAWSPDGRRVAFLSPVVPEPEGGAMSATLNSVSVSTRAVQSISLTVTVRAMDSAPSWSPDGGSVAFVAPRGVITVAAGRAPEIPESVPSAAWVYSLSDRTLTLAAQDATTVLWSPAGDWLAYSDVKGGNGVRLARPDGTGERALLERGYVSGMAWSPDGSRLAACGWVEEEQSYQLGIFDVEEGAATAFPIGDRTQSPQFLAWSPDGAYISYSLFFTGQGFLPDGSLWIVDAQSGEAFPFPDNLGMEGLAVWRPMK